MEIVFRIPTGREYAYVEVRVDGPSPADIMRTMRDIDGNFLSLMSNLLEQGCSMVATGPLGPTVVEESGAPEYAYETPNQPQGYQGAPQGYYQPQNGYQGQAGAYQSNPPVPPGQNAPICQYHQRPAEFKPGGVSQRTGKPYDAFWTCAAGDRNCTKASNFPRP